MPPYFLVLVPSHVSVCVCMCGYACWYIFPDFPRRSGLLMSSPTANRQKDTNSWLRLNGNCEIVVGRSLAAISFPPAESLQCACVRECVLIYAYVLCLCVARTGSRCLCLCLLIKSNLQFSFICREYKTAEHKSSRESFGPNKPIASWR